MPETPLEYLSRNIQQKVEKVEKKESKTKEPACINLPPEIWKGIDLFCKEYKARHFIKPSRNEAIEMACAELFKKYEITI